MGLNNFRPAIFCCSYVLLITSVIVIIPLGFALQEPSFVDEEVFMVMSGVCLVLGALGIRLNRHYLDKINTLQLYLITASCWLLFGFLGVIPLSYGMPHLSFTDALFESFSGITTTGSTVLSGIDDLPRSILVWRGILQWIGGVGIVVLSISVLPFLRVGGMRLFATESSDWSGKSDGRTHKMVMSILYVYMLLTASCAALYFIFGMSPFDAWVHAMTTVSTGGFANYDASFGAFTGHSMLLWVASLFMVLGALPFLFYINLYRNRHTHGLIDSQIRGFLLFLLAVILLFTAQRFFNSDSSLLTALRDVTFNVISVVTTTGYASTDYTLWGPFSVMMFFYLMFVGGCSGSTSGSMKFFRFQLAYLMLRNQLKQMTYPHGVFALKYNDRVVSDDIIRSVVAFSMFFAIVIAVLAALLAMSGLDFVTSLTASITCVTNVGPGLGSTIGPAGNFASLPDHVKWLLCVGMLFGRLEIMTLLVLLTPAIWSK